MFHSRFQRRDWTLFLGVVFLLLTQTKCAGPVKNPRLLVDRPVFAQEIRKIVVIPISEYAAVQPWTEETEKNQLVTDCLKACWDFEIQNFLTEKMTGIVEAVFLEANGAEVKAFLEDYNKNGFSTALNNLSQKYDASVALFKLEQKNIPAYSGELSSKLMARWDGVERYVGESDLAPKLAKSGCNFLSSVLLGVFTGGLYTPSVTPAGDPGEKQQLPVISLSMEVYSRSGVPIWKSYGGFEVAQIKTGKTFFMVELEKLFSCDEKKVEIKESVQVCLGSLITELQPPVRKGGLKP